MTISEKKAILIDYCKKTDCGDCVLRRPDCWSHFTAFNCLEIDDASEEELDRALVLINEQTNAKFIGCEYCKYMDKGEAEPPCLYCKHNKEFGSEEYMTAPELYEPSTGEVLPVARETEERGENMKVKENQLRTIELEVLDDSCLSVALAICKYYTKNNSHKENALIDLDELTEHIDAYVGAERKALEYKKLTEEG